MKKEEKDLFDEKHIDPMLIKEQKEAFNDPEFIFELKLDGLRCLAYLDPKKGTDLRNKRNVPLLALYPELKDIHKAVKHKCILDGELILFENGRPNFQKMQKRSIMKNQFKIKVAASQTPVCFIAFDILYLKDKNIMQEPLMRRKQYLQKNVKDDERIFISRYIEEMGIPFYDIVEEQNLEGIVAKRKESIYRPGKRSSDWIKIKNTNDDDFVVCGYFYQKTKDGLTLIIGQYNKTGELNFRGNVSLGVNNLNFIREYDAKVSDVPNFDFMDDKQITWLKPTIVCTINYMYKTDKGALRQPVLKGFRKDKTAKECILHDD